MKSIERILIKLAIIQFIFLLIAQIVLLYSDYGSYFSKIIQYEGVTKNNFSKIIETFDQ
ncbi:YpfB family protein [Bacillus songklensis]|uniref:YpfB family protein n=1 Tax=Bacillus songklensis TaxID=1069116 RepID=A0ABV8AZ45_9BACI